MNITLKKIIYRFFGIQWDESRWDESELDNVLKYDNYSFNDKEKVFASTVPINCALYELNQNSMIVDNPVVNNQQGVFVSTVPINEKWYGIKSAREFWEKRDVFVDMGCTDYSECLDDFKCPQQFDSVYPLLRRRVTVPTVLPFHNVSSGSNEFLRLTDNNSAYSSLVKGVSKVFFTDCSKVILCNNENDRFSLLVEPFAPSPKNRYKIPYYTDETGLHIKISNRPDRGFRDKVMKKIYLESIVSLSLPEKELLHNEYYQRILKMDSKSKYYYNISHNTFNIISYELSNVSINRKVSNKRRRRHMPRSGYKIVDKT